MSATVEVARPAPGQPPDDHNPGWCLDLMKEPEPQPRSEAGPRFLTDDLGGNPRSSLEAMWFGDNQLPSEGANAPPHPADEGQWVKEFVELHRDLVFALEAYS